MADDTTTIDDVLGTLNEEQTKVVNFLIGEALSGGSGDSAAHSDTNSDILIHQEGTPMNVFDQNGVALGVAPKGPSLTHSQLKTIVEDAQGGSFKESFLKHAAEYGIEDIDILFPDAKTLSNSPDIISRRMEWVQSVIGGAKHSPFSRIKSIAADLTADEARAKGYVKASLKKEEVIKLLKRVTTPTTVYKKQKLDRDDVVDITDIDVIAWLKVEMRLMLDEEIARAILIGDGREPDDEDKIDEEKLRPIAYDDDMYAHKVTIPSNLSPSDTVDIFLRSRTYYKGTGTPTLYTTDQILSDLMLDKDRNRRRMYNNEAELAAAMRVGNIVVVEAMETAPDIIGIVVNIADYTIGADQGGQVSMFDDFDIDYNQMKYLLETRVSGALTKPKSAVIIKRTSGTVVTPQVPSYVASTHTITIPTTAGVDYYIDDVKKTGTVVISETTTVEARPQDGYSFPHNTDTDWDYPYSA